MAYEMCTRSVLSFRFKRIYRLFRIARGKVHNLVKLNRLYLPLLLSKVKQIKSLFKFFKNIHIYFLRFNHTIIIILFKNNKHNNNLNTIWERVLAFFLRFPQKAPYIHILLFKSIIFQCLLK